MRNPEFGHFSFRDIESRKNIDDQEMRFPVVKVKKRSLDQL